MTKENQEIRSITGYTKRIVTQIDDNLKDLAEGNVSIKEQIAWGVIRPLSESDYSPNNDYKIV